MFGRQLRGGGVGGKPVAAGVGKVEGDIHDMGILQAFLPDLLDGGDVDVLFLGIKVSSRKQKSGQAE